MQHRVDEIRENYTGGFLKKIYRLKKGMEEYTILGCMGDHQTI
jgi:hypothetical protein